MLEGYSFCIGSGRSKCEAENGKETDHDLRSFQSEVGVNPDSLVAVAELLNYRFKQEANIALKVVAHATTRKTMAVF